MALYHNSDHRGLLRTLNAGERVDIPCSMATPGGSVQWILNSKPILLDLSANQRRHWNISKDGQTTSLTISRLTKADEGLWECVELDSGGNVRQKAPIMRIVLSSKLWSFLEPWNFFVFWNFLVLIFCCCCCWCCTICGTSYTTGRSSAAAKQRSKKRHQNKRFLVLINDQ